MADFLTANFTGSAGDLSGYTSDSGHTASEHPAFSSTHFTLTGNGTVRCGAGSVVGVSGCLWVFNAVPGSANYDCAMTLDVQTLLTNSYMGFTIRTNATTLNCYSLVAFASGSIEFAKFVSGVYTALGTYSHTPADNDIISVSASGSTFTVSINGTPQTPISDSAIAGAGKIGLLGYLEGSTSTGIHITSLVASQTTLDSTVLFVEEGNSQIDGSTNDLADQLDALLYGTPDIENIALTGQTVAQYRSQVSSQFAPLVSGRNGRVVVLIFDATNSLGLSGLSGEDTYDAMCELAAEYRAIYPQAAIIASTVPYRDFQGGGGFDPDPPDINDRIDDYNTLLLANTLGRFDDIADVQDLLGTDPSVYSTDLIHIDIEPYVGQVADLLADTVNPFLGDPSVPSSSGTSLVGFGSMAIRPARVGET